MSTPSPSLFAESRSSRTIEGALPSHDGESKTLTIGESTQSEGEKILSKDGTQNTANAADDWAHDPVNPLNWSFAKKWRTVAIISFYTFVTPLGSSMMAPALPDISRHYEITSPTTTALTLSIFLPSFGIGPLFLAPLSEMYGRSWVVHIGNLFFLAFNLGCAFSPNVASLIGFRFLCGLAGSAAIGCGGGSVSDLFSKQDRASAMAVYVLGPLLAPALGPIAGGYVSQAIGWKYIFIFIAGLSALGSMVAIPLLRETYAPVIRLRRHRAQHGDLEKLVLMHPELNYMQGNRLRYLWLNLSRPMVILTRSLVCFMLALYMAFMYGCYYLMFATFPELYSNIYGFNSGTGGLAYIAIGLGFLLATLVGARLGNVMYKKFSERDGGKGKPEHRIPALIFGSFFVPIGLFWYGWSAAARAHWIMPMIGTGIFGFGLMTTFLPIQLYLVDTFKFAASALAASMVFRSLLGFVFPLFGQQMYNALGIGGGNSLLAGLAILLGIPFPIWLYYYGERIRARNPLTS